jgi:ribosomal protein L25 (general stress protein Ctc)
MQYNTSIQITVEPIYWNTVPAIAYGYNNHRLKTVKLDSEQILDFSHNFEMEKNFIWIDFFNKSMQDSTRNNDMAVKIKKITIEGMSLYRFIWTAEYFPKYPKEWAVNQINLSERIQSADYLGWNGRWKLNFTVPIFTWIHRLENLGWLYEP